MGTGSIFPRRRRKQKRRDETRLHGRDEPELAMELDRHDDSEWARGFFETDEPETTALRPYHTVQKPSCPNTGTTILCAGRLLYTITDAFHFSFIELEASCCGTS